MTQATLLNNRFSILHIERTSNFSKVFFALDTYQNPPRNCAIKAYYPIAQKPQLKKWIIEEFQKEASRLKNLSILNQYLPEIYTYFYNSQACYIVRELVEGIILREKVHQTGKLSTEMVREILVKLLLSLDNLHQAGIIHQNIKPENIILRHDDSSPISINFGTIEQIVGTFDFHGNQNIFSLNDVYGYTPSEQALGKSIPATDLYSLGLTAIYLLTAKNPTDLVISLDSGNYQIPTKIRESDPDLAAVIAKAIDLNYRDRYSSAREMLNDLLTKKTRTFFPQESQTMFVENKKSLNNNSTLQFPHSELYSNLGENKTFSPNYLGSQPVQEPKVAQSPQHPSWQIKLMIIAGSLYLICLSVTAWHSWKLVEGDTLITKLTESPLLLPSTLSDSSETFSPDESEPPVKKPSLLNSNSSDLLEVPIFTTGTNKEQLRKILGEPNAIKTGYWSGSNAWIYKDLAQGSIDLGYLFDLKTSKLRQTEVALSPTMDLETIEAILDSLLQGKLTPTVALELQQVYDRKTNSYLFKLENLEGTIERDKDDNIYLGVWEADFH